MRGGGKILPGLPFRPGRTGSSSSDQKEQESSAPHMDFKRPQNNATDELRLTQALDCQEESLPQ
jgi:hypothetical protein